MLNTLTYFRPPPVNNVSVRTPRLYQFDRKTDTHVLEDLAGTIDVKTVYYYRPFQPPLATL
jgi:hypothetical protein